MISSFDGKRKLSPFLSDCNSAFELASNNQTPVLLKFTLTQIKGYAKIACNNREFKTWADLKDYLKSLYHDKKHYSQIFNEMMKLEQYAHETVSQFVTRVESVQKQCEIAIQEKDKSDDIGGMTKLLIC